MRRFLVSSFLAEVTQQIHSLRANGVMSAHMTRARESASIAWRRSEGSVWAKRAEEMLIIYGR